MIKSAGTDDWTKEAHEAELGAVYAEVQQLHTLCTQLVKKTGELRIQNAELHTALVQNTELLERVWQAPRRPKQQAVDDQIELNKRVIRGLSHPK